MHPTSSSRRPSAGAAVEERPRRGQQGAADEAKPTPSKPAQPRRAAGSQDGVGTLDKKGADAESSNRKRSRLWQAIVAFFAWIWSLIVKLWQGIYGKLIAVLVAVLIAVAQGQNSIDPRNWSVSLQYLSVTRDNLPVDAGVIGAVAFLAFVSWRASKLQQKWTASDDKQARKEAKDEEFRMQAEASMKARLARATDREYDPQPIRDLEPGACGVDFVDSYYIQRAADAKALEALSHLADLARPRDAASRESIGICVLGPHNSGKSRLVWQALQSMKEGPLSTWTFVVWPPSPQERFHVEGENIGKRRFIILLNKLERYADNTNPRVTRWLNGIRRTFADANVPLIVIATCRQETENLTKNLPMLWDSLDKIDLEPEPITRVQADRLRADLQAHGYEQYEFDPDSPWPGSIVHGLVTPDDYHALPKHAQQVLKVLKLFASVGIGTDGGAPYVTKARVCAVADALFDTPRLRWRDATDRLLSQRMVEWAPILERAIFSRGGVLDVVDYPLRGSTDALMEMEDWPELYQVFKETGDAEAMVALGQAWSSSQLPRRNFPNGPTKLEYTARAADCFRSALDMRYRRDKESDPFTWARTEWFLADALDAQYDWMVSTDQQPSRVEVLQEAATAYQEALTYFDKDLDSDSWISLTTSLGYVLSEQANFMEPEAAAARLEEAEKLETTAADALTPDTRPDLAAWVRTTQALTYLSHARRATESKAVAELEDKASASARKALSQPEALSKAVRGIAQITLGWVIRMQASLKTGEERATLLSEAVKKLREALDTVSDDSEQSAETRSSVQIALVGTLLQHARLVATTPEAGKELQEARQLCEALLDTPLNPDYLAGVQGTYAGVLARLAETPGSNRDARDALLSTAFDYCSRAYRTPNRQSEPDDWAETRYAFADVALQSARFEGEEDRESACNALALALPFLDEAFDVYQDNAPAFFGERQQALDLRKSVEQFAHELNCLV
jgi:hypothetical protein